MLNEKMLTLSVTFSVYIILEYQVVFILLASKSYRKISRFKNRIKLQAGFSRWRLLWGLFSLFSIFLLKRLLNTDFKITIERF